MHFCKKTFYIITILLIFTLTVFPNIILAQERHFSRNGHSPLSPRMMEEMESNENKLVGPSLPKSISSEDAQNQEKESQIENVTLSPQSIESSDATLWDTQVDFNKGGNNNTSTEQFSGDVTLEYQNPSESYTETTAEEFDQGRNDFTSLYNTMITTEDDGEVTISHKYTYTEMTNPALASRYVYDSFLANNGLLYLIHWNSGVSVINTQNTFDPGDDELVTVYNTTSSPAALPVDYVNSAWLDEQTGLLYVSDTDDSGEAGGLTVIDTKNTINPGDDETLITYNQHSTPAIVMGPHQWNGASFSLLDPDTGFLYIGAAWDSCDADGVSVVDTKKTITVADDEFVTNYSKCAGQARLLEEDVLDCEMDYDNGLLYCVGNDSRGVSVIDTKNNTDPADDTSFAYTHPSVVSTMSGVYDNTNGVQTELSATPKLLNSSVTFDQSGIIEYDAEKHILYIPLEDALLTIHTQGTSDFSDDKSYLYTNEGIFDTTDDGDGVLISSENFFSSNLVYGNSLFLGHDDKIYISSYSGGLLVVDTQGTVDPSDDSFVQNPSYYDINQANTAFVDGTTDVVYVGTGNGFSVIENVDTYLSEGKYISQFQKIIDIPTEQLTWDQTLKNEHTTSLQYRTGDANAVWRNDFDDDDPSEFAGDYYGWGNAFQDATESNGTLKLSNPNQYLYDNENSGADGWIDTGEIDEYFPVGSKVTTRLRINSDTREQRDWWEYVFSDDWWDDDTQGFIPNNTWTTLSFVANAKAFSKIGFEIGWRTGTWNNTNDSLEIDYIQIELPDSHWNEWSDECTDNTNCQIDQSALTGNEYIQYKLNLETSDTTTTPRVNSVTYANNYQNTGIYNANIVDFTDTATLYSFNADATIPNNTSINFYYSLDNGETWTEIENNYVFPANTKTNNFQWKATFNTVDPTKTPVIHSVDLQTDQADLSKIKSNEFSIKGSTDGEYEDVTFTGTNYSKIPNPKLRGNNNQAKNGEVTIYRRKKTGSKEKVGKTKIDQYGNWTYKLPRRQDSDTYYYVKYTDSVGNESNKTKKFKVRRDTRDPYFTDLPTNLTLKRGQTIHFPAADESSKIDYYKVKLTPQRTDWRKQQESFYTIPDAIQPGIYTLMLRAYDRADNKESHEMQVRVVE